MHRAATGSLRATTSDQADMRPGRGGTWPVRLVLAVTLSIAGIGLGTPVLAQERPEQSWANLSVLKAGQRVRVVRTNLHAGEGTFVEYTEDAIALRVKGDLVSIPRTEVFRVTLQEHSKRLRNTLIGMAIGGGAALAIGAAVDSSFSESDEHIAKTIFTPIGLGAGAGIGASLAGYETVYRGKLPPRGAAAGVKSVPSAP